MPELNAEANTRKVLDGFKGPATFNKNPNLAPKMTFRDGYPDVVKRSLMHQEAAKIPTLDPWVYRRSNSSMK